MSEPFQDDTSLRHRIANLGEEALGDVAQALIENPLFRQALSTTMGAGERALSAQRSALGALNVPSADDVQRLERRVRSISERVESLEDRIDDLVSELAAARREREAGPSGS